MIDSKQFRQNIIQPALRDLGPQFEGMAAQNLLLGTALVESGLRYLRQLEGGPALGVFQMEPKTHDDIWMNWLAHRTAIADKISDFSDLNRLIYDLRYAAKMARIHYFRVRHPLPDYDDTPALAQYWKDHYNTHLGAGTPEKYIQAWISQRR